MICVNHVVEAAPLLVPKLLAEGFQTAIESLLPLRRELAGDPKRVKPECLNFHRLACARRDNPFANFRIHPGQLHAALAGGQQTVAVHANAKARAARVTFEYAEDGVLNARLSFAETIPPLPLHAASNS